MRRVTEIVWRPDAGTLAQANVTRLLARAGVADYETLVRRSAEEPDWFWPLVVEDLGLEFAEPWREVVDLSRGLAWATWFTGGKVSIPHNCVHRWAAATPERVAAVGLGEDGSRRELTFAELSRDVTRLAEHLAALGVGAGDRVAIFLPMSPEVAIASHACAHLGDPGAGLLRLRRAGHRGPPRGRRRQGSDHRGRLAAPRPGRADEGDRR